MAMIECTKEVHEHKKTNYRNTGKALKGKCYAVVFKRCVQKRYMSAKTTNYRNAGKARKGKCYAVVFKRCVQKRYMSAKTTSMIYLLELFLYVHLHN